MKTYTIIAQTINCPGLSETNGKFNHIFKAANDSDALNYFNYTFDEKRITSFEILQGAYTLDSSNLPFLLPNQEIYN